MKGSFHIAVFDIGKTNKKLVIFNNDLLICDIEKTCIEEFEKDGIRHDNIDEINRWILQSLRKKSPEYDIRVISISAHGATFTCIDENGDLVIPEISYTTDPGKEFHHDFFKQFGSKEYLQETTATPDFNLLLNVGKGIWFVKNKFQESFNKVKYILNLAQYFTFRFTGKITADPTYTGCHSYLWDFNNNTWSNVASKMGIMDKLPPRVSNPWDIAGKISKNVASETGLHEDTIVTVGIHDSNASLLPHLIKTKEDFVLNSTGTWCVIMHQQDRVNFNEDELGKVVFFNISPFFKPVKTTIFMGGQEFEAYDAILRAMHGTSRPDKFERNKYERIIAEQQLFLLPGVVRGTGQFPKSKPRVIENGREYNFEDIRTGKNIPDFFNDQATAYAVLNLSLAIQTKVSLDRADMKDGLPVFTEGGFSNNGSYNILVSAFYPASEFYLTSMDEATAYGAAILGAAAMENQRPEYFEDLLKIKKIPVQKVDLEGLSEYSERLLSLI